jgi:hypothetical protein
MWADVTKDNSVVMGIYGSLFKPTIDKIFDEHEELLSGKHFEDLSAGTSTKNTKISFHASGRYKLISEITKTTTDRVTIQGLPLNEISTFTRMLENLISTNLEQATVSLRDSKDQIIDIADFPIKPIRCTVSCMPLDQIGKLSASKVVDTSIIESSLVLDNSVQCWIWIVRVSGQDELQGETKFYLFIQGKVVSPL